jgi:hypothetical protein
MLPAENQQVIETYAALRAMHHCAKEFTHGERSLLGAYRQRLRPSRSGGQPDVFR